MEQIYPVLEVLIKRDKQEQKRQMLRSVLLSIANEMLNGNPDDFGDLQAEWLLNQLKQTE